MEDSCLPQDDSATPAEWKELIDNENNEIENVDIEKIKQWMEHPKIKVFLNWRNDDSNGNTMLNCAVFYGRLDITKLLLKHGADATIAGKLYGFTALIIASERGHTKIVEVLLDHKNVDINIASKNGDTALIWASIQGFTNIVQLLLDKGADVHITNKKGDTALIYAAFKGHTKIVELLVDKGADLNIADKLYGFTVLIIASERGHSKIVEVLLNRGADINSFSKNGDTALISASTKGYTSIVERLLEKGADLNIANEGGNTALIYASFNGHTKVVELLVDKGADLNIADKDGDTALMNAYQGGHINIVELLVKKGADLNIANLNGMTVLIIASERGHTDKVKLLLDKGADINSTDKRGQTALMYAAQKGHNKVVELLLDNTGADLNIAKKDGDTALSLAFKSGHTNIMELLSGKGADPNVCNNRGLTLLHQACLQNKKASAQKLLEIGIDKNALDNNDHTALFYAAERGFADIVELLLMHNADADKTDERRFVQEENAFGVTYSAYVVKDGRTPLFVAAQNGHQKVVAALLRYGANPYLCNSKSQIPRDVSLVHGPIQQLFRIRDFFDQRDQGKAFEKKYRTCEKQNWNLEREKESVPPLESIIHDVVKYPHFADRFMELYQENRDIVNWLDKDGRPVRQVACKECREAILFLRQYDMDDKPIYESPTCRIYNALDYGDPDQPNLTQPRCVAMKFFARKEHFENEMGARRRDDGSPRFSAEFVVPHLAAYRADKDQEYAKACRIWKTNGSGTDLLSGYCYCVVMPRGERSLSEAMNAENLSAKHKDLERRDMLQKLCKIFSYLHGMGYVHGDVKPHNVVRQMGGNSTWKAIDFDACAKIGDTVGLKLTTGSIPPEMLKIVKSKAEDTESMGESKVVLRQPGGGLDESDLVLADPSFDVWSYGILMYQLITGRSFFHCDFQGNLDDAGLHELANLTQLGIHEKLVSVEDVNARVLLSKILRLDPNERPTMLEVGQNYYFHPSESPQGRKAEFFGKQVFSVFVPQVEAIKFDNKSESNLSTFEANEATSTEMDEDCVSNVEDLERFISSKSEFSYFKLRDEDKDWNDKLLNSEVETFHFDKLGGMGEKPTFIDGDSIYNSMFLRHLLSSKGPDYFMGFLVEYFELYQIMNDAHEVCQGIKANLVSDVKSLQGIFIKLFVRGKGLNDIVRGTLFCNSIDQFKYVGRQLTERYGRNVYLKPPKKEAGAWPIPKLLIYGSRRLDGRCMSVEIQFSTVYMHLAQRASNNHLVYEAMRESTGYLIDKDENFQEFLQSLNQQYIDTEGFLRNQIAQEGRFEILVDENGSGEAHSPEPDHRYTTRATGFILSGRICCGDQKFRFMSPTDRFQRFSESSFVVNKSLTLLSSHSYWSDESYDLEDKSVEFVVSFKGRGMAIAGMGTVKCLHGTTESNGGGTRCSLHVGRSKFVVRRSGVEEVFREKKLPDQERAKIIFKMKDGVLLVSFVGSESEADEETESQVSMPSDNRYYLYLRAPPGVHDVKFHDITIHKSSMSSEDPTVEKAKLLSNEVPATETEMAGESEGIKEGATVQDESSSIEEVPMSDSNIHWI